MSPRKLAIPFALAATFVFGACAVKETYTETVSTQTRVVNGTAMSSLDASSSTGATSGMSGGGETHTRTVVIEGHGGEKVVSESGR